jgi:hypothetical protein
LQLLLLLLLLLLVFAAGPWIEAVQDHNSRAIFTAPRDDIDINFLAYNK